MLQLVEVHASLRPGDAQLAAEAVDGLPYKSVDGMSRVYDGRSACRVAIYATIMTRRAIVCSNPSNP